MYSVWDLPAGQHLDGVTYPLTSVLSYVGLAARVCVYLLCIHICMVNTQTCCTQHIIIHLYTHGDTSRMHIAWSFKRVQYAPVCLQEAYSTCTRHSCLHDPSHAHICTCINMCGPQHSTHMQLAFAHRHVHIGPCIHHKLSHPPLHCTLTHVHMGVSSHHYPILSCMQTRHTHVIMHPCVSHTDACVLGCSAGPTGGSCPLTTNLLLRETPACS